MYHQTKIRWINGPAGFLSIHELPAPDVRWIPQRKAEVVLAISNGLIAEEDACRRYNLTREELAGWKAAFQRHGMRGLCATKAARGFSR